MLDQEQVLAYRYKGVRYDCGSKLGYLKATVEFALRHPEVRDEFSAYLSQRCTSPSSVPA
jgi:UTP--glucose-1-phosphate uridylyltransferase